MRIFLIALLLLASSAFAGSRAGPHLKRGQVAFDQAQSIIEKAHTAARPAERHRLLGIAARWNMDARRSARRASRYPDARTHAFRSRALQQRLSIDNERKKFRASTDIVVQRVIPYRPNTAIKRQATILKRNQLARVRALSTRANLKRESERARLNNWRRARMIARLANQDR